MKGRWDGNRYKDAAAPAPPPHAKGEARDRDRPHPRCSREPTCCAATPPSPKDEQRRTLASSVTHEFNNILTTIINYAKIGLKASAETYRVAAARQGPKSGPAGGGNYRQHARLCAEELDPA